MKQLIYIGLIALILSLIQIAFLGAAEASQTKTVVSINFETGETVYRKPAQSETQKLYELVKKSLKEIEKQDEELYINNNEEKQDENN